MSIFSTIEALLVRCPLTKEEPGSGVYVEGDLGPV
jgi:hypothetical protein